ncbi:MAG: AAA family ATPase [Nitrospira sp.]|nr:AAA family ATPase [Nitrospira sp.]
MGTDNELVLLPQNIEAEQSVLGAILLDGSVLPTVATSLNPEDFYRTSHGKIYKAMLDLAAIESGIDNITLADHLNKCGALSIVGGAAYLGELVALVPGTANVLHHASIVVEKARLRRLRSQLVAARVQIDGGSDLDHVMPLLPDPATLHRDISSSVESLPVISAARLLELEEPDSLNAWIVKLLIAAGAFIGLVGKPKTGKTTWIYELAVKVSLGLPFMGFPTMRSAVLVLAVEEHGRDIRRRLRVLGAEHLENLHLMIGPLDADPTMFAKLKKTIEVLSIRLVIIDTLNSMWTVQDENDAAQVTRAVKPFLELARSTGAAIVALHHARKSEGEHGDEIRGSGALFSLLDAAFILKRHDSDTQRKLTAISRWSETPPELILELRDHGYECLGDAATAGRVARLQKLQVALSTDGQTARELATRAGVPLRAAHSLIDELVSSGRAERQGGGRKGDPFRFVACSIKRGVA